jgi:hypothetical protein
MSTCVRGLSIPEYSLWCIAHAALYVKDKMCTCGNLVVFKPVLVLGFDPKLDNLVYG